MGIYAIIDNRIKNNLLRRYKIALSPKFIVMYGVYNLKGDHLLG